MTKKMFFFAAALALAAVSCIHAQIDPGNLVQYNWGGMQFEPNRAAVLNIAVTNLSKPYTVPVQITLSDKYGNALYRNTVYVNSGQSMSIAIGQASTAGADFRSTIPADIYAAIGPEIRILQARLDIAYPPGPTVPVLDRMTPSMQVFDVATGRLVGYANSPHAIIGVL